MPTSTPPRPHADRKTRPIAQIARDLGLGDEEWIPYGRDKAKVLVSALAARRDRPDGKLVVVSSITPTPAGDGKTTMTIGVGQALWRVGARPVIALREIAEDTLQLPELQEKLILGLQKEKPQDDLEEDTEALDALKEESAILATVESLQAAARETKESREEADAEDAAAAAAQGTAESASEE